MLNNKFSSEVVKDKEPRPMAPPAVIDEEESQNSNSTSQIKSRRGRYAKKSFSSTPVTGFGKFGKGGSLQDQNLAGMTQNIPPGFVPTPPGFMGVGSAPGYPAKGMPYQIPPQFASTDSQNMMPSISQQLNNLNLSNQNMFLQNQLAAGGMMNAGGAQNAPPVGLNQDQLNLLLALQGQNQAQKMMPKDVRFGSISPGMAGMVPMHEQMVPTPPPPTSAPTMPPSAPSAPPTPSQSSNMADVTKNFISSMKDISGKGKTTGILKFFNEGKGFGFFVSDADGKDVFFHYEDVKDLKITKDFLREAKNKYIVKFAFTVQVYYGKYNYSTKAVDIELLGVVDLRYLSNSDSTQAS